MHFDLTYALYNEHWLQQTASGCLVGSGLQLVEVQDLAVETVADHMIVHVGIWALRVRDQALDGGAGTTASMQLSHG